MKICSKCEIEKPFNEFYKNKNTPDGYKYHCKLCMKDKIRQQNAKYYQDNIEVRTEYHKQYREDNRDWMREKDRNRYAENKTAKLQYNLKRYHERKHDSLYRLKKNVRSLIRLKIVEGGYTKKSKCVDILGCSFNEFKLHIESQFEPWMSWDNYGNPKDGIIEPNKTWDIDHVIPTSSAITEEDVLNLNKFNNLQPLCSYVNRYVKRGLLLP